MQTAFRFFSILVITLSVWVWCMERVYAAPQPIGQMVWVKGVVKAIAADKTTRVLERRSVVYDQDTIVTDTNSTGQLVFTDNTLVALGKNTTFEIKQYNYTKGKNSSNDKYFVGIAKGSFRSITGAIAKSHPASYKVNTPVATIGVRGTEYSVILDEMGKAYMQIEKGSIVVNTLTGASTVLTEGTDKVYAQIVHGQVPVVTRQAPAIFEKVSPPSITPASTTIDPTTSGAGIEGGLAPVAPQDGVSPASTATGDEVSTTSTGTTESTTATGEGSSQSPAAEATSVSSPSGSSGNSIKSDGTVSSFCVQ